MSSVGILRGPAQSSFFKVLDCSLDQGPEPSDAVVVIGAFKSHHHYCHGNHHCHWDKRRRRTRTEQGGKKTLSSARRVDGAAKKKSTPTQPPPLEAHSRELATSLTMLEVSLSLDKLRARAHESSEFKLPTGLVRSIGANCYPNSRANLVFLIIQDYTKSKLPP